MSGDEWEPGDPLFRESSSAVRRAAVELIDDHPHLCLGEYCSAGGRFVWLAGDPVLRFDTVSVAG